ncbi:hypothetical protein PCE31107_04680 [Pandoraea cepalis]|uniref:NAD-specific glutamate dehydrogenase n=1 Tax=Pandoraea cepalis TaxID=2508294 RepID=A0A5E4YP64_9BURK|nr:hypothetical protein PCE31107_04680 [Pandoraea cepalis]
MRGGAVRRCCLEGVADTEHSHGVAQATRLIFERAGGRRGFFHERRVLLSDFVHLRHGAIDLLDAARLFARCRRDLAHDVGHALHRLHDFLHRLTGLRHQRRAALHAPDRVFDQHLDFLGRRRAALRQRAHFAGHHGKAAALFARACRFHRRVQRQDVGLERDAFDHADDVDDLVRTRRNPVHRVDHVADHAAAAGGDLRGVHGQHARLLGVVGVLFDRGRELLHRRRRLFQRGRLLLRARRQIGVARRNFVRGHVDRFDAFAHVRNDRQQAVLHDGKAEEQLADFVAPRAFRLDGQVARRDLLRHRERHAQWVIDRATQHAAENEQEDDAADHRDHGGRTHEGVGFLRLLIQVGRLGEFKAREYIEFVTHRAIGRLHLFEIRLLGAFGRTGLEHLDRLLQAVGRKALANRVEALGLRARVRVDRRHVFGPLAVDVVEAARDLVARAFHRVEVRAAHGFGHEQYVAVEFLSDDRQRTHRHHAVLIYAQQFPVAARHPPEPQTANHGQQRRTEHDDPGQPRAQRVQTDLARHRRESAALDLTTANAQVAGLPAAKARVDRLGLRRRACRRTHAHRREAHHGAVLQRRRYRCEHPVEIAVLAAVLDQPGPRIAALDRLPQIAKRFRRHVRMANDVVRCAQQFFTRIAAHLHEGGIGIRDPPLQIRP